MDLICLRIFGFFSATAAQNFIKPNTKQVPEVPYEAWNFSTRSVEQDGLK